MQELDVATITKRSIHGVFALVSRSFAIQGISFIAANILLPLYLSPDVFGVFAVVSAIIAFLSYFSDIGLAAALIQKKEPLTEKELRTTFTVQQILVGVAVTLVLLFSYTIQSFYSFGIEESYLLQALAIAFFLSSLKTIPSVILERNLQFEKLVIPQIVETFFFYGTGVIFAMNGFGITSFTYAVLARGISGLITMYLIAPWKIAVEISFQDLKKLLSFGVPFQLNSFLALLKDDLLIVFLGKILPFSQVGYIGFAQKWALAPLRLVMDNVIRITFPSFSRLQHDPKSLGKAIEKSLFISTFFIFPSLMGLMILFPHFMRFIPGYAEKWSPALFSLTFFTINAGLSAVSTPLTNALNAIGKVQVTLYLMVFWTISTWIITVMFITVYGYNGVSMSSALVACSVVVVVFIVKQFIQFSIIKAIAQPFLATCIMGIVLYFYTAMGMNSIHSFIGSIVLGGVCYLEIMFLIARKEIISDLQLIKLSFKK